MTESLLKDYQRFVDGVTSDTSKNSDLYIARLQELADAGLNVARIETAANGLTGEAGEIMDLMKKIKFHGKPWNEENRQKLIDEAGDISWYWMQLCMALEIDPEEVMIRNIEKLESRYPGGKFSVERSENR